ncbi:MAG: hypothetical protein M9884_17380 [Rhodocyclaceae bacterium]|nr:hypothetical protein [Rhodocyclaceae bacterium]
MTSTDTLTTLEQQAEWVAEQRRRDPVRYEAWAAVTVLFQAAATDPVVLRCPPLRETLARVGDMLIPRLIDTDDLAVIFGELEPAFQSKRARRPRTDPLTMWMVEQVRKHGIGITAGQVRDLLAAEFERTARHPWLLSPGRGDGSVVYLCRGRERRVNTAQMAQRLSRARKAWRER